MTDRSPASPAAETRVLERAVCSGCGCFCDDIGLTYEGEKLVEVERACSLGEAWLRKAGPLEATAMVAGKIVAADAGIEAAAGLIAAAAAPVVEGLAGLSLEAAREAVLLARDVGAVLLPRPCPTDSYLRAGLDAPEFTATLGKVRTTADLVIFWRADPLQTHPRHLERYSYSPPLLNENERTLVVVDELTADSDHETAGQATHCVGLESSGSDLELVAVLEMLLRSKRLDHLKDSDSKTTVDSARNLAELIGRATHTHVFLGLDAAESQALCDALHGMAARVRAEHHVSISSLPAVGNTWGAQEVSTWLLGAPAPLWPGCCDGECVEGLRMLSAGADLAADAFDLCLSLGVEGDGETSEPASGGQKVPRISLGRAHDNTADVSFAVSGLDPRLNASVMRSDGIVLTLSGDSAQGVEDPAVGILRSLRERVASTAEVRR